MELKDVIRKMRLDLCLEQQEFAKLVGVHPSTISSWESGRKVPRLGKLSALKRVAEKHGLKFNARDYIN